MRRLAISGGVLFALALFFLLITRETAAFGAP
jgi:hypothetical protein